MSYERISPEKSILRLFGHGHEVPHDLLEASGLTDERSPKHHRDVGLFAGYLAKEGDPIKALMLLAGERAQIRAEQDAATSKQKIAEIERENMVAQQKVKELEAAAAEAQKKTAEIQLEIIRRSEITVVQGN